MKLIVTSTVSYAVEVDDEFVEGFTGIAPVDITEEHLAWMGNETDGLGWALYEAAKQLPPGRSCDGYVTLDLAEGHWSGEPMNEISL